LDVGLRRAPAPHATAANMAMSAKDQEEWVSAMSSGPDRVAMNLYLHLEAKQANLAEAFEAGEAQGDRDDDLGEEARVAGMLSSPGGTLAEQRSSATGAAATCGSRRSKESIRKTKEAIQKSRMLQRQATPFGGERKLMAVSLVGPSLGGLVNMLPDSVSYYLRKKVDFLEIEDETPISAISSDWSWSFAKNDGSMCLRSPTYFDSENPNGASVWGREAIGAIVVTIRGKTTFDKMARNAEEAGLKRKFKRYAG